MTKFTSFYQVLKDMHTKETWFLFCLTVYFVMQLAAISQKGTKYFTA